MKDIEIWEGECEDQGIFYYNLSDELEKKLKNMGFRHKDDFIYPIIHFLEKTFDELGSFLVSMSTEEYELLVIKDLQTLITNKHQFYLQDGFPWCNMSLIFELTFEKFPESNILSGYRFNFDDMNPENQDPVSYDVSFKTLQVQNKKEESVHYRVEIVPVKV